MKKIITTIALCILAIPAFASDEANIKAEAELKTGQKLPGYLSWSYCDEIKQEFLTSSMRSLQKFNDKQLAGNNANTRRDASLRNTQKYIEARKEWLYECDNYLQVTGKGRIFKDKKTTTKVFGNISSINDELIAQMKDEDHINPVTGEDDSAQAAAEKFEALFTSIQLHIDKANLHGGGLYVTR